MPVMDLGAHMGHYYMLSIDEHGKEVPENPDDTVPLLLSNLIEEKIARLPDDGTDTDVFLVSHGYKTDKAGAVQSYHDWISGMAEQQVGERAFQDAARPRRLLIVGIHWPSFFKFLDGKPYAVEGLERDLTLVQEILAHLHLRDAPPPVDDAVTAVIEATTFDAALRAPLTYLLSLALEGHPPPADPATCTDEQLLRMAEAALAHHLTRQQNEHAHTMPTTPTPAADGAGGGAAAAAASAVGGPPAAGGGSGAAGAPPAAAGVTVGGEPPPASPPRGLFDKIRHLTSAAWLAAARGLVELTRGPEELIFGRFEKRAMTVGAVGLHPILARFMAAAAGRAGRPPAAGGGAVRFHGVGHSLGCHVLSSAVCGPAAGPCALPGRVHSLTLIEPAVHADAMTAGHRYERLVGGGRTARRSLVAGPLVVTTSKTDFALHNYSIWNGPAMGNRGAVLTLPAKARRVKMHDARGEYELLPGSVTNVISDEYICDEPDESLLYKRTVGSHCNIAGNEVCHLVWSAATAAVEPEDYHH